MWAWSFRDKTVVPRLWFSLLVIDSILFKNSKVQFCISVGLFVESGSLWRRQVSSAHGHTVLVTR